MPFEKGQSGNPAGRPKGVPDRRQMVRDLLLPEAPQLVQKAVELALEGDTVMLKACLDKLVPNARQSTKIHFRAGGGVGNLGRDVLDYVSSGEISLQDGKSAMDLLAIQVKLEEQDALADRLATLEKAYGID